MKYNYVFYAKMLDAIKYRYKWIDIKNPNLNHDAIDRMIASKLENINLNQILKVKTTG